MTIIINSADGSTAILFLNNILSLLYEEGEVSLGAVSYTHLTLPTILRV